MTIRLTRKLSDRELVLAALTFNVALIAAVSTVWLSPRFDEWRSVKTSVEDASAEMMRLSDALAVREEVERRFAALGDVVLRTESDQVVLSQFLRDLDQYVREANLTLVNMKPLDVDRQPLARKYPVRLAVAGSVPETVQFAGAVFESESVVGLDRFSIRGVQGFGRVECSFVVSLVQLVPPLGVGAPDNGSGESESVEVNVASGGGP